MRLIVVAGAVEECQSNVGIFPLNLCKACGVEVQLDELPKNKDVQLGEDPNSLHHVVPQDLILKL